MINQQRAQVGMNRTGTARVADRTQEMLAGLSELQPATTGGISELARARQKAAEQVEPLGHIPPPAGLASKAKTAVEKAVGREVDVLVDKLGARLAFERTGTRLYEALITKLDMLGSFDGGPTRENLETILNEEYRHFRMLKTEMEQLGADPTAMTPSADLEGVASQGIVALISDPRTTLLQGLEAILIAELADGDGWRALVELSEQASKPDLSRKCTTAEADELRHIASVRRWVAAGQGRPLNGG